MTAPQASLYINQNVRAQGVEFRAQHFGKLVQGRVALLIVGSRYCLAMFHSVYLDFGRDWYL